VDPIAYRWLESEHTLNISIHLLPRGCAFPIGLQ
jgi:hypothetical protein